ncbi:hypothetical protein ACFQV8_29275 [Pseudonocardia benzenivorans]
MRSADGCGPSRHPTVGRRASPGQRVAGGCGLSEAEHEAASETGAVDCGVVVGAVVGAAERVDRDVVGVVVGAGSGFPSIEAATTSRM